MAWRVDIPTRVQVHVMGILDMCRDHRCLTACQKQYKPNEPAGQVDIPIRVKVHVTGDPGYVQDHKRLTTCQK